MPAYKEKGEKTWQARFYYTDYTGTRKQKRKRGFLTKGAAQAYEREFALKSVRSCDMLFSSLYDLYIEDMSHRIRETTIDTKKSVANKWILPYFGKKKICDIAAVDIRTWQNKLTSYTNPKGKSLSQTYLRTIHAQMSATMNYAVKFYKLPINPCQPAGTIGSSTADAMKIWTVTQFQSFVVLIHREDYRLIFNLLFWGGFREGEALAFYSEDLTDEDKIHIDKNFYRKKGKDIIGLPKTDNSYRDVPIPAWLAKDYRNYCKRLYGLKPGERIFSFTKDALADQMAYYSAKAGLERIRIHDLRHSSASLLIEYGATMVLVAERLGDTIAVIERTYAHLYPGKQEDIITRISDSVIPPAKDE